MAGQMLVLGAGGHARVVCDVLRALGREMPLLLDDDAERWGGELDGARIVGPIAALAQFITGGITEAFVGIGGNAARSKLFDVVAKRGLCVPVLVHPSATVSARAAFGPGTLVCAGAIVNPGTRVGSGVIVNTGAQIDHDCTIGDFVHLGPGSVLCGDVTVGHLSLVGVGASVAPGLRIGAESVIGAGAAVVRSVPDRVTVVGVPARIVRSDEAPAAREGGRDGA